MASRIGISLKELADLLGAQLDGIENKVVFTIESIDNADENSLTFLARDSFISSLDKTKAGAVILNKRNSAKYSGNKIIGENPYALYAKASQIFKRLSADESKSVSSNCSISSDVDFDKTLSVGAFSSINSGSVLGSEVSIGSGVSIGKNVTIGKNTTIYSNVSIYDHVEIGENCILHSGVVVGSDGLGFAKEKGDWVKVEHLGKVIIHDNVEIGSNSCIDRGSVGDTIIHDNVKIDNLVHVAHNVIIGEGTAIAANSGIAGSTRIGKNCTLAGCSAVIDNIEITDEVHITANTLITKSIKNKGVYSSGTPFMKNSDWKKNAVRFKKLNEYISKKL